MSTPKKAPKNVFFRPQQMQHLQKVKSETNSNSNCNQNVNQTITPNQHSHSRSHSNSNPNQVEFYIHEEQQSEISTPLNEPTMIEVKNVTSELQIDLTNYKCCIIHVVTVSLDHQQRFLFKRQADIHELDLFVHSLYDPQSICSQIFQSKQRRQKTANLSMNVSNGISNTISNNISSNSSVSPSNTNSASTSGFNSYSNMNSFINGNTSTVSNCSTNSINSTNGINSINANNSINSITGNTSNSINSIHSTNGINTINGMSFGDEMNYIPIHSNGSRSSQLPETTNSNDNSFQSNAFYHSSNASNATNAIHSIYSTTENNSNNINTSIKQNERIDQFISQKDCINRYNRSNSLGSTIPIINTNEISQPHRTTNTHNNTINNTIHLSPLNTFTSLTPSQTTSSASISTGNQSPIVFTPPKSTGLHHHGNCSISSSHLKEQQLNESNEVIQSNENEIQSKSIERKENQRDNINENTIQSSPMKSQRSLTEKITNRITNNLRIQRLSNDYEEEDNSMRNQSPLLMKDRKISKMKIQNQKQRKCFDDTIVPMSSYSHCLSNSFSTSSNASPSINSNNLNNGNNSNSLPTFTSTRKLSYSQQSVFNKSKTDKQISSTSLL